MKKLTMDVDDLQVESFETGREAAGEEEGGAGGVRAYYGANHTQTTCMAKQCECSAFPTDCDWTCPDYWNAEAVSCAPWEC